MLLVIDSGNTNIVFAVYEGEELRGEWRSSHAPNRTADQYAVWLTQLMALEEIERVEINAAIIATVVPQALFGLAQLCRRYFKCEPMIVGSPDVNLGLNILCDRPEEVGADRLVNAIAAHTSYGGPLIIIDFGTATTFDVIDAEGNYLGGVIAPGVNLSIEALHMAAAQLPRVAIEHPATVIGKNTISAMKSGIYWGYVGLIEGLVARIRKEYGSDNMTVVSTGGLAPLFARATDVIEHLDRELTMRGLLQIHRRNTPA